MINFECICVTPVKLISYGTGMRKSAGMVAEIQHRLLQPSEADHKAIKYFQEHAPTHASYGDYLKARIMDW